jgi:UDP-glucose 4-epimerase
MRTAVTGGAGFIGSHVVDSLVASGHDVLVIDDLSRGSTDNIAPAMAARARLAEIDICDSSALAEAFRAFGPEVVFHLGAQVDVRQSVDNPGRDAVVNILGSINVFAAATGVGVRRVINTSTGGAIYGEAAGLPTPETVYPDPLAPYGLSKRTAEDYACWFRHARGLDVVTLRYGNVYGPRQRATGDAGVVAVLCEKALRRERPVIFGDGRQTRDFVFVADVVAANLAVAWAPKLQYREYNIGTGSEVCVLDLVAAVGAAAGVEPRDFRPLFAPARSGEIRRSCLDVTRARTELEVGPQTSLQEGLSRTLVWAAGDQARKVSPAPDVCSRSTTACSWASEADMDAELGRRNRSEESAAISS